MILGDDVLASAGVDLLAGELEKHDQAETEREVADVEGIRVDTNRDRAAGELEHRERKQHDRGEEPEVEGVTPPDAERGDEDPGDPETSLLHVENLTRVAPCSTTRGRLPCVHSPRNFLQPVVARLRVPGGGAPVLLALWSPKGGSGTSVLAADLLARGRPRRRGAVRLGDLDGDQPAIFGLGAEPPSASSTG